MADNQPDKCRKTLNEEYAALQARIDEPPAPYWYFYNESFYWSTASRCALKLQQPEAALNAMDQSLTLVDPVNLHDRIFHMLFRAKVRIQQEEITEASSIVIDVSQLTASNASQLIVQHINEVRGWFAGHDTHLLPAPTLVQGMGVHGLRVTGEGSRCSDRSDKKASCTARPMP